MKRTNKSSFMFIDFFAGYCVAIGIVVIGFSRELIGGSLRSMY